MINEGIELSALDFYNDHYEATQLATIVIHLGT